MEVKQHGRVSARVALHRVGRNRPVTELAGVVGTPAVPDMHPVHTRESAVSNRLGRGPLKHHSLVHRPNGPARSVPCRALLRSGQNVQEAPRFGHHLGFSDRRRNTAPDKLPKQGETSPAPSGPRLLKPRRRALEVHSFRYGVTPGRIAGSLRRPGRRAGFEGVGVPTPPTQPAYPVSPALRCRCEDAERRRPHGPNMSRAWASMKACVLGQVGRAGVGVTAHAYGPVGRRRRAS
jgi:hypothetical protein